MGIKAMTRKPLLSTLISGAFRPSFLHDQMRLNPGPMMGWLIERHLIECFFGKIKHYRRVFSRFEKKAINFLGFLHFVATLIWMR
ncbi:MAG: hypothetical protein DSZ28_01995 [Thiothrix sp.]|nr:MAG: hypothetical protein DSZ28_01995 [Thiothrix sp.]